MSQPTQITQHTHNGYEWLVDSDFEDVESLAFYLNQVGAEFSQDGFNVYANVDDVRAAEQEMYS